MRFVIMSILAVWSMCAVGKAQTTKYYALIKQVENKIESTNQKGGQFITFVNDKCYESDIDGCVVGNGVMIFKHETSNVKVYTGDSYWGKATFKFSADLQRLNVITSDGTIYVYNRQTPPKSVTTCSLIKSNKPATINSSGVSSGWYTTPSYVPIPQTTAPAAQPTQDTVEDNTHWVNYYRSMYQLYQRNIESWERSINMYQSLNDNSAIIQAGIVQNKRYIRETKQKLAELQREAMAKGITIP